MNIREPRPDIFHHFPLSSGKPETIPDSLQMVAEIDLIL
jgi:hypothetical protein